MGDRHRIAKQGLHINRFKLGEVAIHVRRRRASWGEQEARTSFMEAAYHFMTVGSVRHSLLQALPEVNCCASIHVVGMRLSQVAVLQQ
jgi:hypothetical protein